VQLSLDGSSDLTSVFILDLLTSFFSGKIRY